MKNKILIIITVVFILISNIPQLAFAFENENKSSSYSENSSDSLLELLQSENVKSDILEVLDDLIVFENNDSYVVTGTIQEGYSINININKDDDKLSNLSDFIEVDISKEDLDNNNFKIILIDNNGNEEILTINEEYFDKVEEIDSVNENVFMISDESKLSLTENNLEVEAEYEFEELPENSEEVQEENRELQENQTFEDEIKDDIEDKSNLAELEGMSSKYSFPRSAEINQKLYGDKIAKQQKDSDVPMLFSSPSGISNRAYIESIAPMAIEVANQVGTPTLWPSLMIAQAIHESNFGRSDLAREPNHNLFGIKGTYNGDYVTMKTWEVFDGKSVYVDANFRKYPSYLESFQDYANLMRNGLTWDKNYYSGTWRNNTTSVWEVLNNGGLRGYATDPNYFSKVRQYIEQYDLTKYDTGNYYVRTGTFLSETYTQRQVNALKAMNSALSYSIKIAEDVTPYSYRRIESTREFLGKSAANTALNKLIKETGWSGMIIPTENRVQRFRVQSGYFNTYSEAKIASNNFRKSSGLSVNIIEGIDNKYRLRTGFFNGEQSAELGVEHMRNMGWSANVIESNDYTQYYKIRTGTFNTPSHVKQAKEYFNSNNWGAHETLDSKNNYYYRIFIDGFIYEESALNYVNQLRNNYSWSSFALPVEK